MRTLFALILITIALLLSNCKTPDYVEQLNFSTYDARISAHPFSKSVLAVSYNGKKGGTAFLLNYNGKPHVITAWHVVEYLGSSYIDCYGNYHKKLVGPFIKLCDRDVGIAELKEVPAKWEVLEKAPKQDNYGIVTAWGYSSFKLRNEELGPYVLRSYSGKDMGRVNSFIRSINGYAFPGMSGGPVIDSAGRVFAVVSHSYWKSGRANHRPHEVKESDQLHYLLMP